MKHSARRVTQDTASFLRGNRYIFTYQYHRIELWTSSFTGKEVVKVNGKVVSEARTYRKINQHCLTLNGQRLMLEIHTDTLLKGPVYCTLNVEDLAGYMQPYARKQLRFWNDRATLERKHQRPHSAWSKSLRVLGEIALWAWLGFWLGYFFGSFSLEFWMFLFAAVFIVDIVKGRLNKKSSRGLSSPFMVIEDVSVEDGVPPAV